MRWRLTAPHYLNIVRDGEVAQYEYKETDRNTGRQARKTFPVPVLLDPDNPQDHNYRELGDIIVCMEDKGEPRDIVFVGEPTPDMEPLDKEAEKLSESLRSKWQHPIETLASNGPDYGAQLIATFQRQIDAMGGIKPTTLNGVDPAAFEALQKQVAELIAQNAALRAGSVSPEPATEAPQRKRA